MTDTDTDKAGDTRAPAPGAQPSANYMSYSRMNSILTCGWQFHLERNLKVPSRPHWAAIGGNAFHTVVERLMLDSFSERDAR